MRSLRTSCKDFKHVSIFMFSEVLLCCRRPALMCGSSYVCGIQPNAVVPSDPDCWRMFHWKSRFSRHKNRPVKALSGLPLSYLHVILHTGPLLGLACTTSFNPLRTSLHIPNDNEIFCPSQTAEFLTASSWNSKYGTGRRPISQTASTKQVWT